MTVTAGNRPSRVFYGFSVLRIVHGSHVKQVLWTEQSCLTVSRNMRPDSEDPRDIALEVAVNMSIDR